MSKRKKRKSKVKLPCDRNGTPINVGDWLMFGDGPFHVETLTYYGEDYWPAVGGCWTAEDENDRCSDNLDAAQLIVWGED